MRPCVEDYLPYFENYDLSHEEKVELINSLWRIVESFVDRAFGLQPSLYRSNKSLTPDLQDSANSLNSTNNPDQT